MDWSAGYVADINYNGHYYGEMNPVRQTLALINAGYAPPKIENACELGFGLGVSVNIHAASQGETRWFGNDFLPQQAQYAQRIAEGAGSKAVLTDESFAEFCNRTDLPDFDYICLHGIWSWINGENRAIIVDFIRRKLRVGGIVYASYNVMPGWSTAAPMRELITLHANHYQAPSEGSIEKMGRALDFVEKIFATKPAYVEHNPAIAPRFDQIKSMSKSYLVHEYLNKDWCPMYISDISALLSEAKLTFATTANYHDLLEEVWLTPEQRQIVDDAPTPVLAQQIRDYMVNQQFRRDIWIKGGEALQGESLISAFRNRSVILTVLPEAIDYKLTIAGKEVTLQENIYSMILGVLKDAKSHRIDEIIDKAASTDVDAMSIIQAIVVMIGSNWISTVQSQEASKAATPAVKKFNLEVLNRSQYVEEVDHFASILTGGAVGVDSVTLRIVNHICIGKKNNNQIVDLIEAELRAVNKVLKNPQGEAVTTAEENRVGICNLVDQVRDVVLPFYRSIGVVLP